MIAPDLPLEPAPRNDFSSSMTRPARRRARCQAMLVPMTPPPTIRMSQLTAMSCRLVREQCRAQIPFAEVGQDHDDGLAGAFGALCYLNGRPDRGAAAD